MQKKILKGTYAVEFGQKYGVSVIHLFRREDKKFYHDIISDFRPYFYIDSDEKVLPNPAILNIEDGYHNLQNKPVKKITCKNSWLLKSIKKDYNIVYEGDVMFNLRWLIDNVKEMQPDEYRIHYLDIETSTIHGFPKYDNPIEHIICLTYWDSYDKKYISLLWGDDLEEKTEEKDDKVLITFKTEFQMLEYYLKVWQDDKPSIGTAWSASFDYNYLINRMKKLNINVNLMSPLNKAFVNISMGTMRQFANPVIQGVCVFDLLTAYKKIHLSELTSYALSAVAEAELDIEKLPITKEPGDLWKEKDYDTLIKYNIRDVEIMVELDKKINIIDYWDSMKNLACLDNLNSCFFFSRVGDMVILRHYKQTDPKLAFPSKKEFRERSVDEQFGGGYVGEPKVGLHKNVNVLDFKSLPYNEKILVKSNNRLKYISIGKYIEELHKEGDETLTITDEGEVCWKKVTNIYKHENTFDKFIKIITRNGKKLTVTPNHSIFIMSKDGMIVKRGDELKVGDEVIVPKVLNTKIENSNIPYINEKFKLKLSKDLAEFFGFYLAEGWGTKCKTSYSITVCKNDINIINHYKNILKRFNIDTSIKETKSKVSNYVNYELHIKKGKNRYKYTYGNELVNFIVKYFGIKSKEKTIPNFIYNWPEEFIIAFLKGYLEIGDGYKTEYKGKIKCSRVSSECHSKNICERIFPLALKVGYNSVYYKSKNSFSYGKNLQYYSANCIKGKWLQPFLRRKGYKADPNSHLTMGIRIYYKYIPYEVRQDIRHLTNEEFGSEVIKSIEEIDTKDKYVYDIGVKDTQRFFAGEKGMILCHNSMYPSIVRTFNISSDVISENTGIELEYAPDRTVRFSQDHRGVIPTIIKELLTYRKTFQDKMKDYEINSPEYNLNFQKAFSAKFTVNSVPYNTKIIVKDIYNNILVKDIGAIDVSKIKYALSVNIKTKQKEWKPITAFYAHLPDVDYIYNIKTKYGFKIEASPNHSLFTIKNKNIVRVDAKELKVGDELVLLNHTETGDSEIIDLVDYADNITIVMENNELFTQKAGFMKKMIKILLTDVAEPKTNINKYGTSLAYDRAKKYKLIKEQRSKSGKYYFEVTDKGKEYLLFYKLLLNKKKKAIRYISTVGCFYTFTKQEYYKIPQFIRENNIFYITYGKSPYFIKTKFKLTEEFLKYLGWYISEGTVARNHNEVTICQSMKSPHLKEMIEVCTIFFEHNNIKYNGLKNNNSLWVELVKNLCGIKSINKKLPPFFFNMSKANQDIIVNAYLQGDGHYDKKYKLWNSNTVSKQLNQQLILWNSKCRVCNDKKSSKLSNHEMNHIYFRRMKYLDNINVIPIIEIKKRKLKEKEFLYDISVQDNENFVGGEQGLFLIHNTVAYGVNALTSFRLYDHRVAGAITYTGQKAIKYVNEKCKLEGHDIIYNDTDSNFIKIENKVPVAEGIRLQEYINKDLVNFTKQFGIEKHYLKMEFEKKFKTLLLVAKKRYAGLIDWKDGQELKVPELKVVGLHSKRSDVSAVSKNIQKKVLRMILEEKEKLEIFNYLNEEIYKIKGMKYDLMEIATPTKLEKDIEHYVRKDNTGMEVQMNLPRTRSATWSNKNLGLNLKAGSKFKLIYVMKTDEIDTDCIAFNEIQDLDKIKGKYEVDWKTMMEKTIFMKIENVFKPLGWDKDLDKVERRFIQTLKGQSFLEDFI